MGTPCMLPPKTVTTRPLPRPWALLPQGAQSGNCDPMSIYLSGERISISRPKHLMRSASSRCIPRTQPQSDHSASRSKPLVATQQKPVVEGEPTNCRRPMDGASTNKGSRRLQSCTSSCVSHSPGVTNPQPLNPLPPSLSSLPSITTSSSGTSLPLNAKRNQISATTSPFEENSASSTVSPTHPLGHRSLWTDVENSAVEAESVPLDTVFSSPIPR